MQTIKIVLFAIYCLLSFGACIYMTEIRTINHYYMDITNEAILDRYGEKITKLLADGKKDIIDYKPDNNVVTLHSFFASRGSSGELKFALDEKALDNYISERGPTYNNYIWNKHLFYSFFTYPGYLVNYEEIYNGTQRLYLIILVLGILVLSIKTDLAMDKKCFKVVIIMFIIINISAILFESKSTKLMFFNVPTLDHDVAVKIRTQTKELLKSTSSVKFTDKHIPNDLSTIGINGIFIAKKPDLLQEYIRYNINPFMFIIAGNNLSDPKIINHAMTYRKLGDNVWLGQYENFVKKTQQFNHFRYNYTLIWLFSTVFFLCYALLICKNLNRLSGKTP